MTQATHAAAPRETIALVVGAIAAQVIGGLVLQLSPFTIGGLMDGLSLSERDAGLIISTEFLTLALTAIVAAPLLPRFSHRRAALLAAAVALFAQAASIFSASWLSLVVLRGLAGVGEGALYAVSLSIVASRCSNPDKVYGYFQIVWALGSVALFPVGAELAAAFAHRGILALTAGVTLAAAPFLLFLPRFRVHGDGEKVESTARHSRLLGIMTFAAIVLYLTASAALYAYSTPLGERVGLDTNAVGYALTAMTLVGLAGAAAATALNIRRGRTIPISGFCAAFALVALVLCLAPNPATYVVALVASGVIYYFSIPYMFGIAAALDRNGRWAATAGSAFLIGFAAGPLVGGVAIETAGSGALAALCIALTAAAWVLAILVSRALQEAARVRVTGSPRL